MLVNLKQHRHLINTMTITLTKLSEILSKNRIPFKNDVCLSSFSTMKTGGICRIMIMPSSKDHVISLFDIFKEYSVEYHIIGNGSNIIFPDDPGDDIYVCTKFLNNIKIDIKDDCGYIMAESGALISKVAYDAAKFSLSGLEFAQGIPGTVGGAVKMNASAYNGEISSVVDNTVFYSQNDGLKTITGSEHEWGYRKSVFKPSDFVISVVFKLHFDDKELIMERMSDYSTRRSNSQPLNYPSCGSVFKRPEGYFAGKLIDDAGLKGYTIGGAQVSTKHAGFIINTGNATSQNVIDLIKHIQDVVYTKYNVMLEPEVKVIERKS